MSHPKISPDGKWVAFADHENTRRRRRRLGRGDWRRWQGTREETFFRLDFTAGDSLVSGGRRDLVYLHQYRQRPNPRAVTLSGKLRTITNVPGGMWLEDMRNGTVLTVANQTRIEIRGHGAGRKRGARTGMVRVVGTCATSAGTAGRSCSKKKAMAEDRITLFFCAIRMGRLRRGLARDWPGPSRPIQNGRSQNRRRADR